MIALTPTPFEIHTFADVLLILCGMRVRKHKYSLDAMCVRVCVRMCVKGYGRIYIKDYLWKQRTHYR